MGVTAEDNRANGDPARAFEELRAEVAMMRRAVEALPSAWEDSRPPDYSPDLGRIAKNLDTAATKLEGIEKHPALRLTPEQHRATVARAVRGGCGTRCRSSIAPPRRRSASAISSPGLSAVRGRRDQLFWRIAIPVLVFALTLLASPILLDWLPFGWPSDVAAIVMVEDRWDAGWALMCAVDPVGEEQAAEGLNLVKANRKELATCSETAARTKKDQRCLITVPAQ